MIIEHPIIFGSSRVELDHMPIRAGWVIEGTPQSRSKLLSTSEDGTATTYIWDCTAGRFNWYYAMDETVYFIDGSVVVKDQTGVSRTLGAGDTAFFPAGSHAEWTVETYIRKVAFMRLPIPWYLQRAKRLYHSLRRLTGRGGNLGKDTIPSI